MNKLLRANVSRLFKSKPFWIAFIFMFALGIVVAYTQHYDMVKYNSQSPLDDTILIYIQFIGYVLALFCSLFFGTEYSDGTIRNKLIVGHQRSSIYLANLVIAFIAAIMMIIAYLVPHCILGAMILDPMVAPVTAIIQLVFISIFTTAAFVSIYTMISMVTTKKSVSIVICFILYCAMFYLVFNIYSKLEVPEFIQDFVVSANGVEFGDMVPNPMYLQPEARKFYQFAMDFLPASQAISICNFKVVHPVVMSICSAAISIGITVLGIITFKKRNLK